MNNYSLERMVYNVVNTQGHTFNYHKALKLVESGSIDINYVNSDNDKETILHAACRWGNLKLVQLLVNKKAVIIKNASGQTPHFIAADRGYLEILKLLLNDSPHLINEIHCDNIIWVHLNVNNYIDLY